jgi:hypothetical protein
MAVLKQSTEWVEETVEDENGETKIKRFTRPRLDFVVGPVSECCEERAQIILLSLSRLSTFDSSPFAMQTVLAYVASCNGKPYIVIAMFSFHG